MPYADPYGNMGANILSGITAGINMGFQSQHLELQQKQAKIAEYQQAGKLLDLFQTDPKFAEPIAKSYFKDMGVPDETAKLHIEALRNSSEENRAGMKQMMMGMGLREDAIPLKQLFKMTPSQMFEWAGKAKEVQDQGDITTALQGVGGAGPGMGGPSVAAAPASSPGAMPIPPGPPTPPAGAMQPVAAPGGADMVMPPPTAMPKGPTPPAAGSPSMGVPAGAAPAGVDKLGTPPDMASVPAFRNAANAMRYNQAADLLEQKGNSKAAMMLREKAKGLQDNATITLPGSDPRLKKLGLKPGFVGEYNLVNGHVTALQQGNDTYHVIPQDDPIYKGAKPGTIFSINDQTHKVEALQQGHETFRPLTAEESAGLGSNYQGQVGVQSGKREISKVKEDQYKPVDQTERDILQAQGVTLDPNKAYRVNVTAGNKLEEIGGTGEKFQTLTPAQQDALNLPRAPNVGYQQEKGTGKVSAITTGQTAESSALGEAAKSDQKHLDDLRARATASNSAQQASKAIAALSEQFATGPTANVRQFAGAVMNEFGFKDYAKKMGTAAGEAMETEFANQVLGKGKMLPGSLSEKELKEIKSTAGTMLRTPEGNALIRDLSAWSASINQNEHQSAEDWQNTYGGLSKVNPETKKNWYQTNSQAQKEVTLPPELRDRLTVMKEDQPDPKLIKGWQQPISTANRAQLELLYKNRDKLTPGQALRAKQREMELEGAQ